MNPGERVNATADSPASLAPRRPTVALMFAHPAHVLALGAGSGVMDLSDASQAWSVAIRPLTDHSGREMVSLAVLRDVAPERADEARQRLNLAAAGTAIVALLMGVLFLRVRAAVYDIHHRDGYLASADPAYIPVQ